MCVKLCADQLFSLVVMDSLVTWTQVCVLLGVAKVNLCFECDCHVTTCDLSWLMCSIC